MCERAAVSASKLREELSGPRLLKQQIYYPQVGQHSQQQVAEAGLMLAREAHAVCLYEDGTRKNYEDSIVVRSCS